MTARRTARAIESLETRRLLSAYFVDAAAGSDLNTGRSAKAAWQTLAAVNGRSFKRGDAILLTGTFTNQTLALGPNATGVSVNSYTTVGPRRLVRIGVANVAVFAGVTADGIDISTSNVTVQNISIAADPAAASTGNYNYGVYLHNATTAVLSKVTINRVSATGFSYSGLCMQGWNTSTADSAGFSNVLIENSAFYANVVSGIFVGAGDQTGNEFQAGFPADFYVHSNLKIINCRAYDNAGFNAALGASPDGVNFNRGNYTSGGIFISSVKTATVQGCTVYNNCFAALGSVGLWAFDATQVIFQNDDSYDNKTAGNGDGDGFDFDHGVTDSLMQYDYSHGNQGAGFLLATTGGTSNDNGDTIRYCIANDNGLGIYVQTLPTVPIYFANIYNNTVVQSGIIPFANTTVLIAGESVPSDSINLLNNIFYAGGSDTIVTVTSSEPDVHFQRNDYWLAGAPNALNIAYNGSTYATFADWSAASPGQETVNGTTIGLIQDPQLNSEVVTDLPIASINNLAVSAKSPLRREGYDLTTRPWAGSSPYKLNAPYNLAGRAWGGLGRVNFFHRPINRHVLGAG